MDIKQLLRDNFICQKEEYSEVYKRYNAPLFRKDIKVNEYKTARLYICGLGFYELFLNGKKITKGKFAPYISNPNDYIYYDEYDVSELLNKGENAIGILLGNGWLNPIGGGTWGFTKADWRSSERVSLVLVIDDEVILTTNDEFYVKDSHIAFNDMRFGEYMDARIYNLNDYLYGSIDNSFKIALKTKAPKGELALCTSDPIVVIEERKPLSCTKVDDGYMYDFGENLAGIPTLKMKGHEGQVVQLWHCECLIDGTMYNKNTCCPDVDRFMSQKDILICSGKEDCFEPSFTYHGFRYIYVEGSEGIPLELSMKVLSSKLEHRGFIETNNDILNKIQHITLNSDYSNFFYFPTDCPQREKNGWTGDAQLSCEQFMYNFDCSNSLKVWLDNIRKSQDENGQIPGLIPTFEFGHAWGNGPLWDTVLFELPYQIYRFDNDKDVIKANADAMFKYVSVNLPNRLNENGLINYGLCDWCEAGSVLEYVCSTPVEVTDTLGCVDILNKCIDMFNAIEDYYKVNYCTNFKSKLLKNFREKYVKDCYVTSNTQTSQALAIKVGVFNVNEKETAVKKLVDLIHSNDDLMKYGVAGNKVIYDVLTENGYANLALKLITQDKFPSFNYWLKNDATSLWEAFNEVYDNKVMRKDGGRVLSLNHHFWGTVSAFFYKYIAGLNINPNLVNSNEISIKPYFFKDIDHVTCNFRNKDNYIKFEINKVNNEMVVKVLENKGFVIVE